MRKAISFLLISTAIMAEPLHLEDLVKEAILNSPDIKISKAQYEASEQRVNQADADYLPQVNLNASAGVQDSDYPDSTLITNDQRTRVIAAKVDARQLLYDFGQTGGNMDSFSDQAKAAQASMQQSISNKIFSVKQAYYNLLTQRALIDVNEENVKLNEQQLNRAERYFKAGIRTKVDVTDAQVNLIEAQLSLQDVGYDTKLAYVALANEVGYDSENVKNEIFIVKPELVNVYESLPKLEFGIKYYKKEAYANRAELEEFRQLLQASNSTLRQIDGDYYPGIYANADYLIQKLDDNVFAPDQQWSATVSLEWNLYSGSRTSALSEEARTNIMKSQADLDNTHLRIQKEVNDAYITLNKELDNTKLSESLSIASKEKFVQAQKRYEHGLADFIELQQARQTYIDSRARLTQSYFRYFNAIAQLDRAIGK